MTDSSFLAEGILVDGSLLTRDRMVAPDLAVYETAGAVWRHQTLLGRISDGSGYLSVLSDLVGSNRLVTLEPNEELARETYDLAVRYHAHPHDAVFVALAVMTGLDLRTFDPGQREMHEREKARRKSVLRTGGPSVERRESEP